MRRDALPGRSAPLLGGRFPRSYRLGPVGSASLEGVGRGFAGAGAGAGAGAEFISLVG